MLPGLFLLLSPTTARASVLAQRGPPRGTFCRLVAGPATSRDGPSGPSCHRRQTIRRQRPWPPRRAPPPPLLGVRVTPRSHPCAPIKRADRALPACPSRRLRSCPCWLAVATPPPCTLSTEPSAACRRPPESSNAGSSQSNPKPPRASPRRADHPPTLLVACRSLERRHGRRPSWPPLSPFASKSGHHHDSPPPVSSSMRSPSSPPSYAPPI